MTNLPKVPAIGLSDGDPEFETMWIRGIPHRREKIHELEKMVGGTIVDHPVMLANLDAIYHSHLKMNKKPPQVIEDKQTHERFLPVRAQIPGGVDGLPITTIIYFKITMRQVVVA